jgi:hypothetical protein
MAHFSLVSCHAMPLLLQRIFMVHHAMLHLLLGIVMRRLRSHVMPHLLQGIVMGRLRSQQRQHEVHVMRFCIEKLGGFSRAAIKGVKLHGLLLGAAGAWTCIYVNHIM